MPWSLLMIFKGQSTNWGENWIAARLTNSTCLLLFQTSDEDRTPSSEPAKHPQVWRQGQAKLMNKRPLKQRPFYCPLERKSSRQLPLGYSWVNNNAFRRGSEESLGLGYLASERPPWSERLLASSSPSAPLAMASTYKLYQARCWRAMKTKWRKKRKK